MAVEQELSFVDEQERELFGAAKLGEDARVFLSSHPVGRYLHHRAKGLVQQAEIEALEVDPDAPDAITKLRQIRQRAAVARAFIQWLAEAIMDGDNAARELEEYRK